MHQCLSTQYRTSSKWGSALVNEQVDSGTHAILGKLRLSSITLLFEYNVEIVLEVLQVFCLRTYEVGADCLMAGISLRRGRSINIANSVHHLGIRVRPYLVINVRTKSLGGRRFRGAKLGGQYSSQVT